MSFGVPRWSLVLALAAVAIAHVRVKRDFMYVSSTNETDPDCFQACNTKWKESFEYSLNVSTADFYEFPIHPILLEHSSFLLYCTLAEQKTRCYIDECHDLSADTVFSPSNFICDFKRSLYTEVRSCLAESEPITFLKCDQSCHDETIAKQQTEQNTIEDDNNSVFSAAQLGTYEKELDTLCSFQTCYMKCMEPVVKEVCSPSLASRAIHFLSSFVKWHAVDIYEWHVSADRLPLLSANCANLAEKESTPIDDKAAQIIGRV